MPEPSIFTRIINDQVHGQVIYEDDQCAVLLTIQPLNPGHCLVVPKKEIDHLWDVDSDLYQHLMMVARKTALRMREVYDYPRIGLIVEGFGVPHAHIHVFGYTEPLNETILHTQNRHATPKELKAEADKLRKATS